VLSVVQRWGIETVCRGVHRHVCGHHPRRTRAVNRTSTACRREQAHSRVGTFPSRVADSDTNTTLRTHSSLGKSGHQSSGCVVAGEGPAPLSSTGAAAATRGGGTEPRGIFSQRCYRSDRATLTTPVGVHLPCGSRFPGDELSHRFNPTVRLPRRWQWTLPSQGTMPSVDFRCGGQPPRWPVSQIRHRSRRGRLAHLQQKRPSGSQATLATGQVSNRSRADGRSPSCHALAMMDGYWARLVMAAGRVCRAQASIAVAGHRERSRSGRTAWTISSAARSAACCSPVPGRGSFASSAAFGSVRTVSAVTRASSARGAISAASARRDTSRPSGDLAPVTPLVAVRHPWNARLSPCRHSVAMLSIAFRSPYSFPSTSSAFASKIACHSGARMQSLSSWALPTFNSCSAVGA
jgi:hypothetical protein